MIDAPSELFSFLSLKWSRGSDSCSYDMDIKSSSCTVRGVLSQITEICDILRFLTPFIMWVKSFANNMDKRRFFG